VNNQTHISEFQTLLKHYKLDKSKLNSLLKQADAAKEQEYNKFLLNELVEAKLIAGEQEELERELNNSIMLK
jgi:DNA repair protein RecN (Recombination protein N)